MKRLKNTLLIMFVLSGLVSCSDNFLELSPEGLINTNGFYKNTADFQQALVGCYAPLREVTSFAYNTDEMRSDNSHYFYNPKDRGGLGNEQISHFLDNSSLSRILIRYQGNYNGISRVNVVLDRLDKITFAMAEADKKQITAEAKALRAHYYFDLVRHWGGVPLHLHEVTDKEGTSLPRSSVAEVYAQIIADLTDAMALTANPTSVTNQTGRVTKGMIATELGLVYMTLKQFDKAVPVLTSVTTMGYSLWPNYGDAFKNKNNKESIFEVQYKEGTDGQSSDFIWRFIPIGNTNGILGVSFANIRGGENVPSDDLISSYEAGDKRFDETIGIVEGTLDGAGDFVSKQVVSAVGYVPNPAVPYRYFAKKYFHKPYTLQYNTSENWPIYRYSNLLLLLAESLNETGQSAAALPYLNQVRTRAGLPAAVATDQASLRNIIEHERRIELALENSRWTDLLRTDKAIPVMTAYGNSMKAKYTYLLPTAYIITPERLVYPIPYRELSLNPKLVQNPGY